MMVANKLTVTVRTEGETTTFIGPFGEIYQTPAAEAQHFLDSHYILSGEAGETLNLPFHTFEAFQCWLEPRLIPAKKRLIA